MLYMILIINMQPGDAMQTQMRCKCKRLGYIVHHALTLLHQITTCVQV